MKKFFVSILMMMFAFSVQANAPATKQTVEAEMKHRLAMADDAKKNCKARGDHLSKVVSVEVMTGQEYKKKNPKDTVMGIMEKTSKYLFVYGIGEDKKMDMQASSPLADTAKKEDFVSLVGTPLCFPVI